MRIKLSSAAAAIAITLAWGNAAAAEETYVPPPKPSSLTRADVERDLKAWHDSGLAELSRLEETPDIYSSEYRQRKAVYLNLIGQGAERPATAPAR